MIMKLDIRPMIRGTLGLMVGAAILGAAATSFAQEGPGGPPPGHKMGHERGMDKGPHGDEEGKRQHGKRMMEEMDADKDGNISKGEFLVGMEGKFNELDSDGDGVATPEELKAHHEAKRAEMKEKFAKKKDQMHKKRDSAPTSDDK